MQQKEPRQTHLAPRCRPIMTGWQTAYLMSGCSWSNACFHHRHRTVMWHRVEVGNLLLEAELSKFTPS